MKDCYLITLLDQFHDVDKKTIILFTDTCRYELRVTSGHGLSGFRDFVPFQIWPNFPFGLWTIICGGQKIELAQKNYARRG